MGLLQGGTRGGAAGLGLLGTVAAQDFDGLGARREAGHRAIDPRDALDDAGDGVRLARAGPAAQHDRAVARLEDRPDGLPLLRQQFFAVGAHEIAEFDLPAGSGVQLGDQRPFPFERGAGGHFPVGVEEAVVAAVNRRLDGAERMPAVGLPENLGGEFVDGDDGVSLENMFHGPLDGAFQRFAIHARRLGAVAQGPELPKFLLVHLGELALAHVVRGQLILLLRAVLADQDGDFVVGEFAAEFGFADRDGAVALRRPLREAFEQIRG